MKQDRWDDVPDDVRAMRWNILTVRSTKELAVKAALERDGVDAWVPYRTKSWMQRHRRGSTKGRHKRTKSYAMLPGYVFIPEGAPLCHEVRQIARHPYTGASLSDPWVDLRRHPFIRGAIVVPPLDKDDAPELATVTTKEVFRIGASWDQMPDRLGRLDLRPGDRAKVLFGILQGRSVEVVNINARTATYRLPNPEGGPVIEGQINAASLEPVED